MPNYIDYELDEVYPFLLRHPKQGQPYGEIYGRLSIPINGKAVIAWNGFDDWWLDELYINAESLKTGTTYEYWPEQVSADSEIFKAVQEFLNYARSERVIELIREAREWAAYDHAEANYKAARDETIIG